MKKVIIGLFCFPLFIVNAQTVAVSKQQERVKGDNADGYALEIDGAREDVSPAWNKYLKEIGKLRSSEDMISITEPVIGGTAYAKGMVYATTTGSEKKSKVWIGLKESEWTVNDIQIVYKELEAITYRFGVKFYRDKIQLQINEVQQASDAVDRQSLRLLNQSKDLALKLSNNEREKIRLEKAIEANRLEHEVMLLKIVNNKKSQDSVANAGVQIKKVGEMNKERQRKVN